MKGVRRFAAAGVFVLLALPATPAFAHAEYKESNPVHKSSVSAPPSEVWADFTEPPAGSSRLEIYDPCGQRVDSETWDITAYRLSAPLSSDKKGAYTARFYVTSDLDSHVTTGNFTFISTSGAPCPAGTEEPSVDRGDGGPTKDRNKSSASGPPVQGGETPPASGEIPLDWLMISFGVAGAVGAAGGKVYAGLMGGPKP